MMNEIVVRPHPKAALVVTPHPLTLQGQRVMDARAALFDPTETLLVLLERHGVKPGEQWVVSIEDARVPEAMWSRTRPVEGWLIEARRVPEKDALRLVAIAALSYFTFGAGGLGVAGGTPGLFAAGGAIGGGSRAGETVLRADLSPSQPQTHQEVHHA